MVSQVFSSNVVGRIIRIISGHLSCVLNRLRPCCIFEPCEATQTPTLDRWDEDAQTLQTEGACRLHLWGAAPLFFHPGPKFTCELARIFAPEGCRTIGGKLEQTPQCGDWTEAWCWSQEFADEAISLWVVSMSFCFAFAFLTKSHYRMVIVGFRRFDVCSGAWGNSELIGVVLPRGQRYNLGLPGWAPSSFGTACTHWRRSCFSPITTCITPGVKLSMWSTIELKQECIFRSNRLYYFNSMVSSSCFVCNSLLGRWRQPGFAGRSWASWGRWTWVWERVRECCRYHVEDELLGTGGLGGLDPAKTSCAILCYIKIHAGMNTKNGFCFWESSQVQGE